MPALGEIRRGQEIGQDYGRAYIWQVCPDCGKERWCRSLKGKPLRSRCKSCRAKRDYQPKGNKSYNWRGGRFVDGKGYVHILLQPDDFYFPMAQKAHYVLEHRLVMAKVLGRCLHSWEVVHHKRGFAKDDNRYPETLQLVSDDRHRQITILENKIDKLLEGQEKLRVEIRLLRLENKQLRLSSPPPPRTLNIPPILRG